MNSKSLFSYLLVLLSLHLARGGKEGIRYGTAFGQKIGQVGFQLLRGWHQGLQGKLSYMYSRELSIPSGIERT